MTASAVPLNQIGITAEDPRTLIEFAKQLYSECESVKGRLKKYSAEASTVSHVVLNSLCLYGNTLQLVPAADIYHGQDSVLQIRERMKTILKIIAPAHNASQEQVPVKGLDGELYELECTVLDLLTAMSPRLQCASESSSSSQPPRPPSDIVRKYCELILGAPKIPHKIYTRALSLLNRVYKKETVDGMPCPAGLLEMKFDEHSIKAYEMQLQKTTTTTAVAVSTAAMARKKSSAMVSASVPLQTQPDAAASSSTLFSPSPRQQPPAPLSDDPLALESIFFLSEAVLQICEHRRYELGAHAALLCDSLSYCSRQVRLYLPHIHARLSSSPLVAEKFASLHASLCEAVVVMNTVLEMKMMRDKRGRKPLLKAGRSIRIGTKYLIWALVQMDHEEPPMLYASDASLGAAGSHKDSGLEGSPSEGADGEAHQQKPLKTADELFLDAKVALLSSGAVGTADGDMHVQSSALPVFQQAFESGCNEAAYYLALLSFHRRDYAGVLEWLREMNRCLKQQQQQQQRLQPGAKQADRPAAMEWIDPHLVDLLYARVYEALSQSKDRQSSGKEARRLALEFYERIPAAQRTVDMWTSTGRLFTLEKEPLKARHCYEQVIKLYRRNKAGDSGSNRRVAIEGQGPSPGVACSSVCYGEALNALGLQSLRLHPQSQQQGDALRAFHLFSTAMLEVGDANAAFNMGAMLEDGLLSPAAFVMTDAATTASLSSSPGECRSAKEYYEVAARQGHVLARVALARLELSAPAGNYEKAWRLLTELLMEGVKSGEVYYLLGWMALHGTGAAQNFVLAYAYFSQVVAWVDDQAQEAQEDDRVIDGGNGATGRAPSAFSLLKGRALVKMGDMQFSGIGVDTFSVQSALDLYTKAAHLGNAEAANGLGVLYEDGEFVPADISKARKWYEMATELGDANAPYNLARLLVGVAPESKDLLDRADGLMLLAGRRGNVQARAVL